METITIELSSYKNALSNFHIHKVSGDCEAQKYHQHNYFQMYYVRKGYLTHNSDFGTTELSYGDVFIIPPNYKHAIALKTSQTEFYSCSFTDEYLTNFFLKQPYVGGFLTKLLSSQRNVIKLKLSIPSEYQIHLQNILEFLLSEYNLRPNNIEEIIQNSLGLILSILSNIYFTASTEPFVLGKTDYKDSILYSLNYIKERYNEKLSLDAMAKIAHMQRKDFCIEFKKTTGHTFNDWLNKLRIEKAVELLKNTEIQYTLRQVAIMVGYDKYITFYRNFMKRIGIPPQEYIQKNSNM